MYCGGIGFVFWAAVFVVRALDLSRGSGKNLTVEIGIEFVTMPKCLVEWSRSS